MIRSPGLAVALVSLALGAGCAGVQKNMSKPNPMESRFGHVVFAEERNQWPQLAPAPQVADATPPKQTTEAALKTHVADAEPAPVAALLEAPRRPSAPKPTEPRGLEIEEVKGGAPVVDKPMPGLGDGTPMSEVLEAARRLVGVKKDLDERGFLVHLLKVADIKSDAGEAAVKALYEKLNATGHTFGARERPVAGDLCFFHNTRDRDDDGRADDWFTMAGVVESVDEDGTVHFIGLAHGEVSRFVMNLERPSVVRDESTGQDLNSTLREKSLADRPFTAYLAGELFAGYGHLGH